MRKIVLPAVLSSLLVALAACMPPPPSPGPEPEPPPAPTGPATPAPTETAPPTATATTPAPTVDITGTWKSPACGTRKYERQITFAADGTFSATDLVSPCPPNVRCIWSGIVNRSGKYTSAGDTITFTSVEPQNTRGAPFPASLTIDPATHAPVERADDGSSCVYQR